MLVSGYVREEKVSQGRNIVFIAYRMNALGLGHITQKHAQNISKYTCLADLAWPELNNATIIEAHDEINQINMKT